MTNLFTRRIGMIFMLSLSATLAACGHRVGSNSDVKIIGRTSETKTAPEPIRALGSEEIRSTIMGKTWQYTATGLSGFVTYNEDGSLSYQDDTKGDGTGTWSAVEGQLCQAIAGKPTECGEFKSTGDAYYAGKMRLAGA
ncbi:hypothetical protein BH10PSE7_BH10PSE7_21680 [soil metagenome]